jgi:outer membrane protein assembly factor BamB
VNPKEKKLKPGKVDELRERWRYETGAIVTASPTVASIEVPGEGRIQVVYVASWDNNVYALRFSDGSRLWSFAADIQPGASLPAASSVHVERVGERDVAYVGLGETVYALDAATGDEVWRFVAGTGCTDVLGDPPGLCSVDGERNQVETSPIVADGKLFFGMDVNDVALGKGGFYAVDAADGRLEWFFDLETGSTCVPDAADEIRRFDGYHTEEELGLPAQFLATRAGCDFDRTPTGCANVWSSPAVDFERELVYFGSSNCDTDEDPNTNEPPPPMPPYDEGLTALRFDGTPAWRWRPREIGNTDLAFGATPNLFTIKRGNAKVEVVGIGGKDGAYYVIDRDGVNEDTGLGFEPADPLALPYWFTQLVPGGPAGGVIGTPLVDEKSRRIVIATAPGFDPVQPQQPTVRALDLDTGAVLWDNAGGAVDDASFGPVGGTPKLAIVGSIIGPMLRIYDAKTGQRLLSRQLGDVVLGSAIASGPVVVDGTILVGTGIGTLVGDPGAPSEITARIPSSLFALCVPGSKGCPKEE